MPVEVSCDGARAARYARTLRTDAVALMGLLERLEHVELSLLLTGDTRIARLNREYRHKDGPTDVLSFGQIAEPVEEAKRTRFATNNLLGDVVISVETAARQAAELDQSVEQRLRTLLVHGVLHLMGFDHERPADARRMFAFQDTLENQLGKSTAQPARASHNISKKPRSSK